VLFSPILYRFTFLPSVLEKGTYTFIVTLTDLSATDPTKSNFSFKLIVSDTFEESEAAKLAQRQRELANYAVPFEIKSISK
jgi:hypothetical protein